MNNLKFLKKIITPHFTGIILHFAIRVFRDALFLEHQSLSPQLYATHSSRCIFIYSLL